MKGYTVIPQNCYKVSAKDFSPIPKDSAYLTLVNKFILLIVHF